MTAKTRRDGVQLSYGALSIANANFEGISNAAGLDYSITGAFVPARTFNVGSADLAAVRTTLATLIVDLNKLRTE